MERSWGGCVPLLFTLFHPPSAMPELPEVEVSRLSFAQRIAGGLIQSVALGKPLRWPLGVEPQALCGSRVLAVTRRGKYLLLHLQRGGADGGVLLMHLGMSGSLLFAAHMPPAGVHDHFSMVTSAGTLRLHDPRRFGAVVYARDMQQPVVTKLLGRLGVEPLSDDFDATVFVQRMQQRRSAIKSVLLAGEVVVGVGNIYACEVLFQARIAPTLRADQVDGARMQALHAAIRSTLARAVAQGGSTLRDFSSADGQAGHFQTQAAVYGRQGLPCPVCATPIARMQQGQRSTFFCPVCQRC